MRIQIDVSRPRWLRKPTTWKARIAVLAVVLLTVSVPVAWASHDFADVPDGHQFHSQISAIKTAGITTGCGGGNYCPDEFVRRDAMAAFLQRASGRGGVTQDAGNALTTTPTDIATRSITTPGAGFVLVSAHAMAFGGSGCPCSVQLRLRNTGTGASSFYYADTIATGYAAVSNTFHFPVAAAGTHTFAARMHTESGSATADVTLSALWVPFGSTGGSSAGVTQQGTQQGG